MSIKIGITGGIGSGKSVVSHLLEMKGIPVYDSDKESKRIVNYNETIRMKLIELLGEEIYNGKDLNKKLLASFIFGNPDHLKVVNSIIHPAVKIDFLQWAKTHESSAIIGFESAILIEAGFTQTMDYIVSVQAPMEIRIKRVAMRDRSPLSLIEKRINSQMNDEEKCRLSDFIIINDDKNPLIPQVLSLIASLSKKHLLSLEPEII